MFKSTKPKKKTRFRVRKSGELEALEQLFGFLDKNEPETVRWLVWILDQQEHSITYAELESAYLNGNLPESFLRQWQENYATYVTETLVPVWEKAMTSAVILNSASEIGALPVAYMPSKFLFQDYLKTQSATLVTNLSTGQSKAVQSMLSHLLGDKNMSSVEAARYLRPLIGLTNPQMKANKNFYDSVLTGLLANGKSFSQAHAIATRQSVAYAGRQHRDRAITIARTELATAYNQAHFLATQEAVGLGLVEEMVKIVCSANNERMCPFCGRMHGEAALMKDKFSNGFMTPPFHPNCRCVLMYMERWLYEELNGPIGGSRARGANSSGSSSTTGGATGANTGTTGANTGTTGAISGTTSTSTSGNSSSGTSTTTGNNSSQPLTGTSGSGTIIPIWEEGFVLWGEGFVLWESHRLDK